MIIRDSTRQIFTQIFWVKSESTAVCLSKNLSFIVFFSLWASLCKFATHSALRPRVNSWNKNEIEKKLFIVNCSLIRDIHIVEWGWRCVILWFFNLPSVKMLIFSLKFDQSYPFTKMTQKVCQKAYHNPFQTKSNCQICLFIGWFLSRNY